MTLAPFQNQLSFVRNQVPRNASVGVSGIGPAQLPASIQSVLLGGHARTGLEDILYYAQDELATNQRLVERLVRIIRDMGFEPVPAAGRSGAPS
jgi:3-keto-5-aminohexanoate cleavage enzyme